VYSPQLVRAVETTDGAVVQDFPPRVRQKAKVAPENLARVNDALGAVVNDPKGTAYPVREPTLDIAGKTGTAQTGYVNTGGDDPKKAWYLARDHAWFAAYWPAKAPEIAVVVLVEHGGSGPTVAAPIAIQIVREYHRLAQLRARPAGKAAGKEPQGAPADAPAAKGAPSAAALGPDGLPAVPDPLAMPPQGRPEDPPYPDPAPSPAPQGAP
jgi:penicillin-binding protein 2